MLNKDEFKIFKQYARYIGINEAAEAVKITNKQAYHICYNNGIEFKKHIRMNAGSKPKGEQNELTPGRRKSHELNEAIKATEKEIFRLADIKNGVIVDVGFNGDISSIISKLETKMKNLTNELLDVEIMRTYNAGRSYKHSFNTKNEENENKEESQF